MRKIILINRIQTFLAALILVGSASLALGDDRFALAPSDHDNLVVFGPKGDRVAELSVPTISQVVTVGATSFQISYGRDANNYVTAILAPSSSQPQDLHFTVLNKSVDADKEAVVTLTFPDSKHVTIDPGYVGNVSVNSHTLRHRDVAESASGPAPTPAPRMTPRVSADIQPLDVPPPATHSTPPPAPAPEPVPVVRETPSVSHEAVAAAPADPVPAADQSSAPTGNNVAPTPPPMVGSLLAQPPMPVPGNVPGGAGTPHKKLFWAEPITPPSGTPLAVGIDQMKLTAVHGPVTVNLPNGETKPGTDGMIVPSGSSISTADGGSAAVFMGGVDSARFLPDTQAKVSQNLDGSLRHTSINLKVGTVFSRVGHRPGEKQDYEVRTPEGVAAARGTSYAVCVTNSGGQEVTICATQDGVVTLTDSDGHKIFITPLKSGQVSIGSIPKLPASVLRDIFTAFLTDVQQFNTNMQAIANMANPSPADLAYYNANQGFDTNTQFYDVLSTALVPLFPFGGDATEFLDRHNDINDVVPATRRALDQQLEPFGTVPLTPF